MAIDVILPALGMSQESGKILQWLKVEGEQVARGEPLAEIETDKATVEIEAPTDGVLAHVAFTAGDDVPVGQVIAVVLAAEEVPQSGRAQGMQGDHLHLRGASPLASRIAAEHSLDLSQVKSAGKRIQKADVLTHLQNQDEAAPAKATARLMMASPKARRLAAEQGKELATIKGTGPGGAVVAADVLATIVQAPLATEEVAEAIATTETPVATANELTLGNTWRIMAQRTTQSWTSVPHFYLVREVNASRLITWREQILKRSVEKVSYTDLLVKIAAAALRMHPRLNASWNEDKITLKQEVHIGIAVAIEEGLVVPVIHRADTLSLEEIAHRRRELTAKAQD